MRNSVDATQAVGHGGRVEREMNMNEFKYILVKDGNGVWAVSFGPFRDLAVARVAASRLDKRGVICRVVSFDKAKEIDLPGADRLGSKCVDL